MSRALRPEVSSGYCYRFWRSARQGQPEHQPQCLRELWELSIKQLLPSCFSNLLVNLLAGKLIQLRRSEDFRAALGSPETLQCSPSTAGTTLVACSEPNLAL